ncbi:MAG: hypothetical protein E6I93_15375 [Chloroflexi bacterium]|nr:MAG: hypothetical protein E6I93_15375 [Chloroflexota bacterium]
MSRKFSGHAVTRAKNLYQAYVLLLLGIIFLLLAWLLHPSTSEYPIGVMMLGIGMAIAALLNPYRLVIASWLTTLLGIAVFLSFSHRIPGDQVFPAYIIAMGVALIGIALMGRRGYIKAGAITPGIIVLLVGIIEALLLAGRTPNNFVPFMLSLWLPGIGLCVLGLLYVAASIRD